MAFLGAPVRWPDALPIDDQSSIFHPLASQLRRYLPAPLATLPSSFLVSICLTFTLIVALALFSATLNARRSSLLVSEKAVPASSATTTAARRKPGQPITALLVGPEQTGKSSIFSALVFQAVPETQTSQHENESKVTLTAEAGGEKRIETPVQLVDLPGHPRLRAKANDYLPVADKIVFCVDTTTAIRGASTKNDTLVEAVDQFHATLTSLARLRLFRSSASKKATLPPSVLVLFTRGDLSPLLSSSPYDAKRQSQVVARARAAFEAELGRRRAGMGLGRGGAAAARRAKVGGMSEVVGGSGSGQGGGGWFGAIKSLFGLGSSSAKPVAAAADEDDEDDDGEGADYVDWAWAQRGGSGVDSSAGTAAATALSLDKLDEDVVSGGKASFAVACLGKERGWAMGAPEEDGQGAFQGLKAVNDWLADSSA